MTKKQKEYQVLKDLVQDCLLQSKHLKLSCDKCSKVDLNQFSIEALSEESLEAFEALVSRFGRLSDMLTQKIFRLIDELEYENHKTFIDRINAAEKRELIDSAYEFREIREIRNKIEHEYESSNLLELFAKTLEFSPQLLKTCDKLKAYLENIKLE